MTNDTLLENDGERMVPEFHKGSLLYGEHLTRYIATQKIVRGKTVLDIASGSGYGTKIIASQAKKVYGVDLSKKAIQYASKNFSAKNIEYLQGSGVDNPLKDNSVDVVTTFETIEHIEDYKKFMQEIKRVLKPDGLAIISTPNDLEFTKDNHFHVHEFRYEELKKLINRYFTHSKSYFQTTWLYEALLEKDQITKESEVIITTNNLAPVNIDKSLYFYILCSNRKITEKVEPIAAMSEHWSTRNYFEQAQKQQHKDNLTNDHIKNLEKIIINQKAELNKYKKVLSYTPYKFMHKIRRLRNNKNKLN